MFRKSISLYLALYILLLFGCQPGFENGPQVIVIKETSSPVATPESTNPTEVEITPPDVGFGSVGGILLTDNQLSPGTLAPLSTTPIFLAPALYTEEGAPAFVGLDQDTDPATATGQTGVFVFQNVPPGLYGLVVMHGVKLYLITDDEGNNFIIDVEADKAYDLGEVYAELPPL